MAAAMGLPVAFGSSKGKYVPDNDQGGALVVSKRKFRQYMNRRGGSRLLDNQQ